MTSLSDRQITLMLKIDQLGDEVADELELALAIVGAIAEALLADLCLMCLPDEDSGQLELRALVDKGNVLGARDEAHWRLMIVRAASTPAKAILDTTLDLGQGRALHYLGAPLHAGSRPLGALLLARAGQRFTPDDQALLSVAVSQTDTAMVHAATVVELRRRTLELEAVLKVDQIRDAGLEFQQMLDATLGELSRVVPSGAGFIMLFDKTGRELELRAMTHRDFFARPDCLRIVRDAADEALRRAEPIAKRYPDGPVRSLIGIPLILNERVIGVLGVLNRAGRDGFSRADRELLRGIASQIDTAIFESLETQRLRAAFSRNVGPQVMRRLLDVADRDLLKGDRAEITTLFSDIRGFTGVSEKLDVEVLEQMLNEHLGAMTELVLAHDGTLDKYVGDCVMAFFNAPERQPDHARRAVRLALEMQRAHGEVMKGWAARGLPAVAIGIGISTGPAIVGNFGSNQRSEYTAIGADVNLASRLCGAAEGNQTLISESTYTALKDAIVAEPLPPMHLKGIAEPVKSWAVLSLK
ncbi:MAG: GAF domain-containing protein [Chloroflexi bacterium]|nr:GAF domain-containing protein [Chloroflexota bacterium]